MKLKDIKAQNTAEYWIEAVHGEVLEPGLGMIKPDGFGSTHSLLVKGKLIRFRLKNSAADNDFRFFFSRGTAHLAEIISCAKDGSALMSVVHFASDILEMGDVEIGIDDTIVASVKKRGLPFRDSEDLASALTERCRIEINGEQYFILLDKEAFFDETVKESKSDVIGSGNINLSYAVHGVELRMPVQKMTLENDRHIFSAMKVILGKNPRTEGALRLCKGKLTVTDHTKAGNIGTLAAATMKKLMQKGVGYLAVWDKYGAIEGEKLIAKAVAIGEIHYESVAFDESGRGVRFFVKDMPEGLDSRDFIELTHKKPFYLDMPDMTWQKYANQLEYEQKVRETLGATKEDKEKKESVVASILKLTPNSITLGLEVIPDRSMHMILSIRGDEIQIERRMRARRAIIEGRSAMPFLGALIEENGELPLKPKVGKVKPLTPFVEEKIFDHPPRQKQVEAIDIALNTPDIALIQGPPGTGKTTVVTAILERLNEIYDKRNDLSGQVLVSGFQHDAVENIIARLSINALPTTKFGGKHNTSLFSEDETDKKITAFCEHVSGRIRAINPQIKETIDLKRILTLSKAYVISPSQSNGLSLLSGIVELPGSKLDECLKEEARDLLNDLTQSAHKVDKRKLRLIRRLRTTVSGFMDDGVLNAKDFYYEFESELSKEDMKCLEIAIRWKNGDEMAFLSDLQTIQRKYLQQFSRRSLSSANKHNEALLNLSERVKNHLKQHQDYGNERDRALAEFLHELESNPAEVRAAIEDYNFVYAATTQQSDGKAIRRRKLGQEGSGIPIYDTVIIDEAARTSPRDLMIPMVQAAKRIILVGDHRQLPHLIDQEVSMAYENEKGDDLQTFADQRALLDISMFEYLFKRLQKLEKHDGIQRTVTLDAQFRTHPLLGEFLYEMFYKKHGEYFGSPLKAEAFKQSLSGTDGKAPIWLDVPYDSKEGKEVRQTSGSRYRRAEAKAIAIQLREWMTSPAGKELTFGVISFYKAQVNEVMKALSDPSIGITSEMADGSFAIEKEFQYMGKSDMLTERLRIGTVDAFQGMEFDVVFLSMVRSVPKGEYSGYKSISDETVRSKKQRSTFGHLMSDNRLCVSMSRQKKVLVTVGDSELIQSDMSMEAVPALSKYYELCKDQGVLL